MSLRSKRLRAQRRADWKAVCEYYSTPWPSYSAHPPDPPKPPPPAPKPIYRRDKDRKGRRADWAEDNRRIGQGHARLAWAPRRKGSPPHGSVERTRNGETVRLAANRATRRLLQSKSNHHGSALIRAQYENT